MNINAFNNKYEIRSQQSYVLNRDLTYGIQFISKFVYIIFLKVKIVPESSCQMTIEFISYVSHVLTHNDRCSFRQFDDIENNRFRISFEVTMISCVNNKYMYKQNLIIFTFLYPAHSRIGRGNLLLRYSIPHFSPNSEGMAR